eukprot:TRINITY_DN25606_c0_g1_i1.p1 TRINITY_DN25606_c0_g1~~TRINITY_DN25606_c0_g1_i1.p1  ORF type:complete len:336 (+),score=81.41 TRINITY_DN25606_c0_g1_i1:35-1042(+)
MDGAVAARAVVDATWPLVVGKEATGVAFAGRKQRAGRVRAAIERLVRLVVFYVGVALAFRARRGLWGAAAAALLQRVVRPFPDDVALFLCLRAASAWLGRRGVRHHLQPLGVFAVHCVHNAIMLTKADWVNPAYLSLWLQAMPLYPTRQHYLDDFASPTTATHHYAARQVAPDRLQQLIPNLWRTLRVQLPAVAAVYLIPKLLFIRNTLHELSPQMLLTLSLKVAQSAGVLTCLPYILTEFPALVTSFRRRMGVADPATRLSTLHIATASALSTAAFLMEPKGRLEVMIVYTYWRVIEALLPVHMDTPTPSSRHSQLRSAAAPYYVGSMCAFLTT